MTANRSIVPTKLNMPHTRVDVIPRLRIFEILNEGLSRHAALTLLSAPAGYGKTTLVVSWLRSIQQRPAWLSLTSSDDDLPRFISYLVSALQHVRPSLGKPVQQFLEEFRTDASRTEAILSSLAQDVSKLKKPLILVLEDYHFIESSVIHAFMEGLIEQTFPHLHIVVIARQEPPLPLARWRVRNQLTELRALDLKFTLEEARQFLQQVMGLHLLDQESHLIQERTEGWVAGLQLAALSLRNHPGKSSVWTLEGGDRGIADYLMSEVLGQLAPSIREFLLKTSIVDRLSGSVCNALMERTDSQAILEALEADNLFTIPLDDSRESFRYHHLFMEFLRNRLTAQYPEDIVQNLHRRASHWLVQNENILEAIPHALAARDYEFAACLIAPQSEQWMRRGQTSTILKHLNQLPKEFIWTDWHLCLWYGWVYALKGELSSAERWTNRLEELITPLIQDATLKETKPIPEDLQNAYVQVLAIRSIIVRTHQDFHVSIDLCEQALRLVPEGNIYLRTIVSTLLASARLEAEHFDAAETLLQSARKSAHRTGNPFILYTMMLNESALAMMRGRLRQACALNLEAFNLTQTAAMPELGFLAQLRLGCIHFAWNQLPQARQYVMSALEQVLVDEYPAPVVQGHITLALIQNARGQRAEAMQILHHAELLALTHHESESVERLRGTRAQMHLLAGEKEAVARWLKSSGWESFDPDSPGPIFNDESFFAFCQFIIASKLPHEWKRVERLLEWRLADCRRQRRQLAILQIHLAQAFLHHTRNHPDRASDSLLQALEVAWSENIVRPFLDEGRPLIPYLSRIPRQHQAWEFAQTIRVQISGIHDDSQPMIERLSEQEFCILQLMAQGHTNPEIARERVLAVSTVRWYARQIFRKLGVHNRTQATTQARKLNLL